MMVWGVIGAASAYQSFGIQGSGKLLETFPAFDQGQSDSGCVRQCHSCGLFTEPWGCPCVDPECPVFPFKSTGKKTQNCYSGGTYSRCPECAGRQAVAKRSGSTDRVISAPSGLLLKIPSLWTPLVDLFATSENHKLPVYVGPIPDGQALAVDSMSLNWTGMYA